MFNSFIEFFIRFSTFYSSNRIESKNSFTQDLQDFELNKKKLILLFQLGIVAFHYSSIFFQLFRRYHLCKTTRYFFQYHRFWAIINSRFIIIGNSLRIVLLFINNDYVIIKIHYGQQSMAVD